MDRRDHITMTIRIDGTVEEFIVDTGSAVTIIPPDKEIIREEKKVEFTGKVRWKPRMKELEKIYPC